MTGERFGRLVGVAFSHRDASGHANWLFACDCGSEVIAKGTNVRGGNTTSCGCMHREISAARLLKHGHRAGGRHGPTYRAWQMMNDACSNPHSPKYPACGGRGIKVCAGWRNDFEAFRRDMGERPIRVKLDRLDRKGDFEPANCSWTRIGSDFAADAACTPSAQHREQRHGRAVSAPGVAAGIRA